MLLGHFSFREIARILAAFWWTNAPRGEKFQCFRLRAAAQGTCPRHAIIVYDIFSGLYSPKSGSQQWEDRLSSSASVFQLKNQGPMFLIGLGHGATHWIAGTFYVLLPFMTKDLGLSYTQAGMLVSILHVSSFCANIGSGAVVDMTGRR
ncbi:MAG: hypothetical protein O3A84_17300, partial [Proteobacteria bacterium]|nr:hypothetical protein [Pseudomonadota bacterium]